MLIKYGLFDSAGADERVYVAEQMAVIFRALALSGVSDLASDLKITAAQNGMQVNMAEGMAMVNGYIMHAMQDGGGVYALVLNAGGTQPRIDRIVVRLNLSTDSRQVLPAIKQGTPAATPKAPELTRAGEIYEISLAQIYVPAGAAQVTDAQITDERANEAVCGGVVPRALKISGLGATHAHEAATAQKSGFMTAAQVVQLGIVSGNQAEIAQLKNRTAALEAAVSALQGTVNAHAAQLSGLTAASMPAFKGLTLTGTLNMGGNYIDNALFR